MEELQIKNDYKKWFSLLLAKTDKELLTMNWKYTFTKLLSFYNSDYIEHDVKLSSFTFLNKIITKSFLITDTEIKTYFNSIIPIIISHFTNSDVCSNPFINFV